MKIVTGEWLKMDAADRFYSIAQAIRQNDANLKEHKKSLRALACK